MKSEPPASCSPVPRRLRLEAEIVEGSDSRLPTRDLEEELALHLLLPSIGHFERQVLGALSLHAVGRFLPYDLPCCGTPYIGVGPYTALGIMLESDGLTSARGEGLRGEAEWLWLGGEVIVPALPSLWMVSSVSSPEVTQTDVAPYAARRGKSLRLIAIGSTLSREAYGCITL